MKDKVFSLAKGNFIYEAPRLVVTPGKLEFEIVAGEKRTETFTVANERGSKLKGFGSVEEPELEFLPVFDGEENVLELEVNAQERVPGERLQGQIHLVTDCGEYDMPYDIRVVAPVLEDSKGQITDYHLLKERIIENPENGAKLFQSAAFRGAFLYRDESGKLLYDHLVKRNTKLHSMEEFLVGMRKKKPIHFTVRHRSADPAEVIEYESDGTDIRDFLEIRVDEWGSTGIQVSSTADFIQPEVHVLWTDEFDGQKEVLEFTIQGVTRCCSGSILLESPYETKEVLIRVRSRVGARERRVKRARKAVLATTVHTYLAYREKRISADEYLDFLWKHHSVLEKVSSCFNIPVRGYIQVKRRMEKAILEFYQEAEVVELPPIGSDIHEIENYILIQYIKSMYSSRQEDREQVIGLLDGYEEGGYSSLLMFYVRLHVDERYGSVRLKEKDIREQIEMGINSPLLYSEMMLLYRQDPGLIRSLDEVTLLVVNYGIKADLITEEIAVNISFLADKQKEFHAVLFAMLEKLYLKFQLADTLRDICAILIRNEIRDPVYFPWFARGVEENLRLTDLYEYYMYTIDRRNTTVLPSSVISYFQYENHLNETCKAFLYAYLIKKREEKPEDFRVYGAHIREFTLAQLGRHRISEDIGVLYEGLLLPDNIQDSVARELPYVLFSHRLVCHHKKMESVLVVHRELAEEKMYTLTAGKAVIEIYTPNYQLLFVDGEGRYYAGTVEYTLEKLLHLDDLALRCYENGADRVELLAHLAVQAERAAKLDDTRAGILHAAVRKGVFRDHMNGKVLLCLYDYYKAKDTSLLLEVLDRIRPEIIKRERLGDVAANCICHGLYDKAEKMLMRYGVGGCDKKALSMLVLYKIQERRGGFSPVLVKWGMVLFREHFYDRCILQYLLQYYMGKTETLAALYRKCLEIEDIVIDDGSMERLLGQVLFACQNPEPYDKLFLEYYQNGINRVLVKAFLSQLAYEYIVGRVVLSEDVFVKIEKEAFYEKEQVMVLAALRYYARMKKYARKQQEFIELNLENYASEGLILGFMKEFIGKVSVPYEIENAVLIQYNSGTEKGVFLFEKTEAGKFEGRPMKKVFAGIYIQELLLFEGEERVCYIYEEESDEKTEEMHITRPKTAGRAAGFFQMVNQMIEARERKDEKRYESLRRRYEEDRQIAEQLFTMQ